jgi:hypothetical protein
LKHTGNHRYYLALEKGLRRALDARLADGKSKIRLKPYPKFTHRPSTRGDEQARWTALAALVARDATNLAA